MYNEYYLIKRIEEKESDIPMASATDSFTYQGEVVKTPKDSDITIGTHVLFMKDMGEDVVVNGEAMKVVSLEDLIMKIDETI